jgi:hypothetical protein
VIDLLIIGLVILGWLMFRAIDNGTFPKHEETWMPGYGLMDTTSGFWFAPGCTANVVRVLFIVVIIFGVAEWLLS